MRPRRSTRRSALIISALALATSCTGHAAKPNAHPSASGTTPSSIKPEVSLTPCGPHHPDALPLRPTKIVMATDRVGWAVEATFDGCTNGPWTILRTRDGGARWRDVTPSEALDPSFDPTFLGTEHAWAVVEIGRRRVVTVSTNDAGAHWQRGVPFTLLREPAGDIDFVDTDHGWLVQDLGAAAGSEELQIMRTSDAGRTWRTVTATNVDHDVPGRLPFGCSKGASFSSPLTAWAAGECAGTPFFMVTRDGGRTWRSAETTLPGTRRSPAGGGNGDSTVGGEAGLPAFFSPSHGVIQLQMYDPKTNSDSRTIICVTDDGGRHWRRASLPKGRRPFQSVFQDGSHWWLVDGNARPRIYVTDDGGGTWRSVTPDIDLTKYSLDVVGPRIAYAFEINGATTLRATDGGRTWQRFTLNVG